MAVTHVYKCSDCGTEVEVEVKRLGDGSDAPACPSFTGDDETDSARAYGHEMKRSYKIGGAFIKW